MMMHFRVSSHESKQQVGMPNIGWVVGTVSEPGHSAPEGGGPSVSVVVKDMCGPGVCGSNGALGAAAGPSTSVRAKCCCSMTVGPVQSGTVTEHPPVTVAAADTAS